MSGSFELAPGLDSELAAALGMDNAQGLEPDLLSRLASTVAAAIKQAMPDLADCRAIAGRFDVEALQDQTVRAPGVLVALVGWRSRPGQAGQWAYQAQLAAFIVTKDRMGLPRDVGALNIAQAVTALVEANRWRTPALGQAEQVAAEMLVTATSRTLATSLAVVTWVQPFVLTGAPTLPVRPVFYLGSGLDMITVGPLP